MYTYINVFYVLILCIYDIRYKLFTSKQWYTVALASLQIVSWTGKGPQEDPLSHKPSSIPSPW